MHKIYFLILCFIMSTCGIARPTNQLICPKDMILHKVPINLIDITQIQKPSNLKDGRHEKGLWNLVGIKNKFRTNHEWILMLHPVPAEKAITALKRLRLQRSSLRFVSGPIYDKNVNYYCKYQSIDGEAIVSYSSEAKIKR